MFLVPPETEPPVQKERTGPLRYIINKTSSLSINGATVPFPAGTLVSDESMIVRLLEARANMSPIHDEDDLGTCPHCQKSFSLVAQRGARALLARARQLMPGYS